MGFRQDRADGFEQFLGLQVAGLAPVGARRVLQRRDAVFLVAGEPGLDRAPGELAGVPLLVGEGQRAAV